MPSSASQSAKSGWSLGPWPQMPTYLPVARQAAMAREISALTAGSRSSKSRGQQLQAGVAVQAERELRQVVRADREAVEVLEELLGQDGVARHLAHHDHAQAVVAAAARFRPCSASMPTTRSAWPSVRTNGTMISTLVRPMSLRTRFSASHSIAKASPKSSLT